MSVLAAVANGNLTSASTWALVDATTYSNSESANTALTTSYVESSTTTPGAITVDGVGIKVASVNASPTGTISVHLAIAGVEVTNSAVTVNITDLPQGALSAKADGGWFFFKFTAPLLLVGATLYSVGVKTSVSSMVNLFSTTTTNWSRYIRTTTTQAPVATDDLIIAKEWTAATTGTARTVTMDSTSTTEYGSSPSAANAPITPAVSICLGGTLSYGTSASTNYVFRLNGDVVVYNGGTFNMGIAGGSEIPRTSTAVIEFHCVASGDYGLVARNKSTVSIAGLSRTSGKNVTWCLLGADAAATSTALTTAAGPGSTASAADTGWLSGDVLAIAATGRPGDDGKNSESKTLNVDATATTLTTTAGLTNAKSGTSPTQGEIINLTRNVKFRSTAAAAGTFLGTNTSSTASIAITWCEFSALGGTTAGKRGIEVDTISSGSFSLTYCCLHDCPNFGIYLAPSTTALANVTVQHNTGYLLATNSGQGLVITTAATTSSNFIIDDNVFVRPTSYGMLLNDVTGTVTNNRIINVASGSYGIGINIGATNPFGTWSGNVIHSCSCDALQMASQGISGTMSNDTIWRCGGSANVFNIQTSPYDLIVSGLTMFGNLSFQIVATTGGKIQWKNCNFNGDTTFATTVGLVVDSWCDFIFDNCLFSQVSGILTAHTSDFSIVGNNRHVRLVARNCKFLSSTLSSIVTSAVAALLSNDGYFSFEAIGQVAGAHGTVLRGGYLTIDTAIFNTSSSSQRLTPISTSVKLPSAPGGTDAKGIKVPVTNGTTATVTVKYRTSLSTDSGGANYNGNNPRLIQRANPALGQNSDVLLATGSVVTDGAWRTLSASTSSPTDTGAFEIIVDCDGTAGWVNVDDWSTSAGSVDPAGKQNNWFNGLPFDTIVPVTGSGNVFGG